MRPFDVISGQNVFSRTAFLAVKFLCRLVLPLLAYSEHTLWYSKTTLPRTSRLFLSSFLNTHLKVGIPEDKGVRQ
ncbi:hypothetical protein JOD43_003090 [Pullulanibacillus pueri]|nr:hypothetical protein [Pullulanibacillus pueri]